MGVWGISPFDNDEASDWIYELEENPTVDFIVATFQVVTDKKGDEYLEASDCSQALIAAEVVAFLHNKPSKESNNSFTNAVKKIKLKTKDDLSRLRILTIKTTQRILNNSELKDLWKESKEYDKWTKNVNELLSRLT